MNTAVTICARCTGKGGAHYAYCFLAQAWERFMGPGYPWAPPAPQPAVYQPQHEPLVCVHNIELSDPCVDCLPPPREDDEPDDPDWEDLFVEDPPDPQGVMEDFLVGSGHVESDANWMPHLPGTFVPGARTDDSASVPGFVSIEVAKTELPDGYLDAKLAALPPKRTYSTEGIREHQRKAGQAREDAAVQFVYDACEFVTGGRVLLSGVHGKYTEWAAANGRPSMSELTLRNLLVRVGLTIEPGRLPGERTSGRAPLLVHGVALRTEPAEPTPPKVVVKPKAKRRDKHALIGCKPGRELPKQVRDLIEPLITEQRWSYEPHNGSGKGKPRLITPDGKTVTLPSTPHLNGHTLENTRQFIKSAGGAL